MVKKHTYSTTIQWKGNTGLGTKSYTSYERSFEVVVNNKATLYGSSDPLFRGDNKKHNPEEFLVASLSSCHMLWYLHLCSQNEIEVVAYEDEAVGIMQEYSNGSGKFSEVCLNPTIIVTQDQMIEKAIALHEQAHALCFIANSVNFKVDCKPNITSIVN